MTEIEELLRELTPRVIGAVARRFGDFDAAEDAVQEALVAAAVQWPVEGIPANPLGWLITVATRRMTDLWRSERARRNREEGSAALTLPDDLVSPAADVEVDSGEDDSLTLFFMCCHPAISATSQVALTLRAVGGLTTSQIAHAFLVPEATMAQRISRAKQSIKSAGARFQMPPPDEIGERLHVVLHVLYLIFNEGYTSSGGEDLLTVELSQEAIRLCRALRDMLPEDGEVAGLLALMLLTDARRPARVDAEGRLVPLAEQDRFRWNRTLIAEGLALIAATLTRAPVGPYQLQAAIAAIHDEAGTADATDWPQILALYDLLQQIAPSPVVTLNRAVAVAMADGPEAGLRELEALDRDDRLAGNHRLDAVRAHLLEMAGDRTAAVAAYSRAAQRTTSLPERRYLENRSAKAEGELPRSASE